MKQCPGYEKAFFLMAEPVMVDSQCDSCKHKADPYCKMVDASMFYEDRTPIEDRWPVDVTDTADPNYMG